MPGAASPPKGIGGLAAAPSSVQGGLQLGGSIVHKGFPGTVRYIGQLQGVKGEWIGLEYEQDGIGEHNGSYKGKKYFDCPAGRGVFVPRGSVYKVEEPASPEEYRQVFQSWNAAESRIESAHLASHAGLGHSAEAMLERQEGDPGRKQEAAASLHMKKVASSMASPTTPGGSPQWLEEPGALYKGPRLSFGDGGELVRDDVMALITHFKHNPEIPIAPCYLLRLLEESKRVFAHENPKAVFDARVPSDVGGRMIVCGDTHGQLPDLFWVFFKHDYPSAENVYLMNGDIADRGDYAVEIFTILLCFKLLCPASVLINKGNHEEEFMNARYGFQDEVKRKYDQKVSGRIYQAFQELFMALPLATVVDGTVLVIHGGLSRKSIRLEQLRSIQHQRHAPDAPGRSLHDTVFYDALWSDPRDVPGITRNPRGGDVIAFGPDVASQFLQKSQLRMIIRSHEVPASTDPQGFPRGFEWHHPFGTEHTQGMQPIKIGAGGQEGLTLTVFTASNYCGSVCNLGAVVVFRQSVGNFDILEHYANSIDYILDVERETMDATQRMGQISRAEQERRRLHIQQSAGKMKTEVMHLIKSEITRHKNELFSYWWDLDVEKDLHVTLDLWKEGLEAVLHTGQVDWDEYAQTLGVVNATQRVNYPAFLHRFQIRFSNKFGRHAGFRRAITDNAFEALLLADLSMRETFAVLDRNDDGLVSIQEFQKVLESAGVGLTRPQIQALFRTIIAHASHPDAGGRMRVEDFLGRLQLRYHATHQKSAATGRHDWVPQALMVVAREMLNDEQQRRQRGEGATVLMGEDHVSLLTEWFHRADQDQTGFLSLDELAAALRGLPSCEKHSPEQLRQIGEYIDIVGNGRINYLEFLNAFHLEDTKGNELAEDMLEYVYRRLHFDFETPLRRTFHQQDPDSDGRLTKDQFERCVSAVNAAQSPAAFSKGQIKCLLDTLTLTTPPGATPGTEPSIDYDDWLKSFEIVDTVLDEVL